jgi:hypothetical protein
MSKHTIHVHANGHHKDPLPVTAADFKWFVSVDIGDVSFFVDTVADAADLSERISVAVSALMADDPANTRRLRSAPDREHIAEMTADEWEVRR